MRMRQTRCLACLLMVSSLGLLSCGLSEVQQAPPALPALAPANDVLDVESLGLKPLWRADLGRIGPTRLAALYAVDGLVIAETPSGEVHMLRAATGQWQTVKSFTHGLDVPPVAAGKKVYFVSGNRVYQFEPETGQLTRGYSPQFGLSTPPVPFEDGVLLAGGNGHLAGVRVIDWDQRWMLSITGSILHRPVLDDDNLFVAASEVICVEAENGDELWRWEPDRPSRISSGVAVQGETLYVGDNRGFLYALDTDSGSQQWRKPLGAPLVGRPEVVGGGILVFTGEPLAACVKLNAQGEMLWTCPGVVRLLARGGEVLYVLNSDNSVSSVSAQTGEEIWRENLPQDCHAAGDPERPMFYVGDSQGSIVAFLKLD